MPHEEYDEWYVMRVTTTPANIVYAQMQIVALVTRLGFHKSTPSRGIPGECTTVCVSKGNVAMSRVCVRNISRQCCLVRQEILFNLI